MKKHSDFYFDYEYNLLKNKLGLKHHEELEEYEYQATSFRKAELEEQPINIKKINISLLKKIHYYLFQDVYDWAGKYREVNISKEGKNFFPYTELDHANRYMEEQISEYMKKDDISHDSICRDLSKILIDLNHMHPFREGNGRTQREFIRQLAYVKGYELSIESNNELYMEACVKDNEDIMFQAIKKELRKIRN